MRKKKFKITPRIAGYSFVLVLLLLSLSTLLAFRSDVETTLLRTPGQLYQNAGEGKISNLYNMQIVNKTFHDLPLELRLKSPSGQIKFIGNPITSVQPDSRSEGVLFIVLNEKDLIDVKTKVELEILSGNKVIDEVSTNFLGPGNENE